MASDLFKLDPPVHDGWPRFTKEELREISKEERYVQQRLKEIGLESKKVKEDPKTQTCDLRAWTGDDPGERFWIEVKTRFSDEALIRALKGEKTDVPFARALGYSNTTAGILKHAVSQLDSLAEKEEGFEIAWILSRSPFNSELHFQQAIATVFGTQIVTEPPGSRMKPCYFFGESAFFKHKQLDAIVVEKSDAFKLCLNPYAARLERFRKTKLFAFFNPRDVIDPHEEEKTGRGYVADCDIDRRLEKDVLAFVGEKYGLKNPVSTAFRHRGAYAIVPLIHARLGQAR